ncbi:MAG: hypothetical protein Q7K54_06180 [Candidatus Parcubacteria bacterium]|nr:hypothetical protein [Candidatus Parcubacteria bacterium]
MILEYLNKDNLHHAYLIEGNREEILPEIFIFVEKLGVKKNSPDFYHTTIDNFKIDEALSLRTMGAEKSFSLGKKIFILCVNTFSLDAQNVLLKMFEEPIEDTHFFVITPDIDALLKTLVSRFYFISARQDLAENKFAENFIKMPVRLRIDFIKEFLTMPEEEDLAQDSARTKALNFLNALESILSKTVFDTKVGCCEHLFKVREFLRMPGSSAKTLLESVALIVPNFKN